MEAVQQSLMSCTKCVYLDKIPTASFYGKLFVFGKPWFTRRSVDLSNLKTVASVAKKVVFE